LRDILIRVEQLFAESADRSVKGTLFAYGSSKRVIGPVAGGLYKALDDPAIQKFAAYRAEFSGSIGEFDVWANVTEGADRAELDEAGDNIGALTSLSMLEGIAQPIISEMVRSTKDLAANTTTKWLGELSNRLRQYQTVARSS
jgi:hypothetical protein